MSKEKIRTVQKVILRWYAQHQRDLPWRKTKDPYAIAVSEVMLQQTQVDRVIPKYQTWLKTFPTIKSLASAPLRKVLTLWSGLGYNNRALRLRMMAQEIISKHQGQWPRDIETLKTLPGFGSYTAGAVAAFAFDQRVGIVDTNVHRVISRIFFGLRRVDDKKLMQTVHQLVPSGRDRATWHHALMDFGSLVCTSQRPKCLDCPVRQACRAYPTILSIGHARTTKPQPSFKDSDRFWRGQIIRLLTKERRLSPTALLIELNKLGSWSRSRQNEIIQGLVKDKLVKSIANDMITLAS